MDKEAVAIIVTIAVSIALVGLVSVPTASAQKGDPSDSLSWSPRVRNEFTWSADSFIQRKAPPESYVETENLLVEPNYTLTTLDNVEIYDNSGNNKVLIDTIPAYQVVEENETFVKYRPPGKNVYLFTIENVRINGRKPPFHTEKKLDNPAISLDVRLSDFGRRLIEAINHPTNFMPYLDNYYLTGLDSVSLANLRDLYSELDNLPVYQGGSLKKEVSDFDLSLSNESAGIEFKSELKNRNPPFALARGKLGSHSLSWSVSSQTDWWGQSKASAENDVRTTVKDGSLRLTGENAVGCWSMDEFPSGFNDTDNTVYDLTSYVNDGTAKNGPTVTSGQWDNALSFDGADDAVDVPDPSNLSTFTVVAVSKHRSVNDGDIDHVLAFLSNNGFMLRDEGDGSFSFRFYDGGNWTSIAAPISNDVWNVWIGTYDGSTAELFKNGSSVGTASVANDSPGRVSGYIGKQSDSYPQRLDGVVDEVYLFERVLSDNEIQRIYERTKPPELTGEDLKTGTYTSEWHDLGVASNPENFVVTVDNSAPLGSAENVYADLGADWDNDGAVDENTGWTQITSSGSTSIDVSTFKGWSWWRSRFKLQTENTVHSPEVTDFELQNIGPYYDNSLRWENLRLENASLVGRVENTLRGYDNLDVWFQKRPEGGTWENVARENEVLTGDYSYFWDGLSENSSYDFRFVMKFNPDGTSHPGDTLSITTPLLDTENITGAGSLDNDKAELNLTYETGSFDNADLWFDWRESGAATWNSTSKKNYTEGGSYSDNLTDLSENTQYEFRARMHNFRESENIEENESTLTLTTTLVDTLPAQNVTNDSAELTAKIAYGKKEGSRVYDNADLRFDLRPQGRTNWTHTGTQNVTGNEVPLQPAWALHADQTYEYRSHVMQFYPDGFETPGNVENFKTETTSAQVPSEPPVNITLNASWYKEGEQLRVTANLENQDGGKITGLPTPDNVNFDLISPQGNMVVENGRLPELGPVSKGTYDNASAYEFSASDNTGTYLVNVWAEYKGSEDWETTDVQFKKWMQEALENVSAVKENIAKTVRLDLTTESVSWYDASADFWATATDSTGQVENVDNVELRLYNPDNNLAKSIMMTKEGDYWTASVDTGNLKPGHWEAVAVASKDGREYIRREPWRISSGPFDVSIASVSQNPYSPAISTDLKVESNAAQTKDVYLKWTLHRGIGLSGEKVYEESETHAVGAGETWTPTVDFDTSLKKPEWYTAEVGIWWGPKGSSPDQMYEHARASKSFKYSESGRIQRTFNPSKAALDISMKIGAYAGAQVQTENERRFTAKSRFSPGDRVTVATWLSVNGIEVSHADVVGHWNGRDFDMKDKYGNKFEGSFTVPKDAKPGTYLISVDASAGSLQSTASKTITVEKAKGISPIGVLKEYWWLVAIIVIILLLIALS